jgi:tetraprenyl-beta-curcumene synthase
MGGWRRRAEAIPDPVLRRHALTALTEKSPNPEAVAVFAILAPHAHRRGALRAIVALQVAIDYIDILGEQAVPDPLKDGLHLHRALSAAVAPGTAAEDWYRFHPQGEDGGYLSKLVLTCQRSLESLPAAAALQAHTAAAAQRCGLGQSYTHAAAAGDVAALEHWARRQDAPEGYSWWEVAAGASSSVAAHALIAAAADRCSTARQAQAIDAAYFPSIGALTVLLDDLIDHDHDAATGEHSYIAYYADGEVAAERLGLIAARAEATIGALAHPSRHAAILTGVVGFYLGAEEARLPFARPARDRLLKTCGSGVKPIAAVVRLRQQRKRPGDDGSASGPSASVGRRRLGRGGRP